jgi:hypothetical protein
VVLLLEGGAADLTPLFQLFGVYLCFAMQNCTKRWSTLKTNDIIVVTSFQAPAFKKPCTAAYLRAKKGTKHFVGLPTRLFSL